MRFLRRILHDCSGASSAEYGIIVLVCGVGLGAASLMLGANTAQSVSLGSQATYASNATPGLSSFGGGGTGSASTDGGSSGGGSQGGGQDGGGTDTGGDTGGDTGCGTLPNGKPKKC